MPQCAKCGKKVKIVYVIWKYKEPLPEFYDKPLCASCYSELDNARKETAREVATEELREHLRQMGLEGTLVTFKKIPILQGWSEEGSVMGAFRVANRNIDLIELVQWFSLDDSGLRRVRLRGYGCNFVVQAKVDGLKRKLRAKGKPVRKSFWRFGGEVVNFRWSGGWELTRVLGSDASLGDTLYRIARAQGDLLEIKPYREHKCVRIRQKHYYQSPKAAFPSIETFEVFDRIAQHIRSIINRPS